MDLICTTQHGLGPLVLVRDDFVCTEHGLGHLVLVWVGSHLSEHTCSLRPIVLLVWDGSHTCMYWTSAGASSTGVRWISYELNMDLINYELNMVWGLSYWCVLDLISTEHSLGALVLVWDGSHLQCTEHTCSLGPLVLVWDGSHLYWTGSGASSIGVRWVSFLLETWSGASSISVRWITSVLNMAWGI